MTSKVLINIHEGTIEVEGEADFVNEVYSDFKEHLIPMMKNSSNSTEDPPAREEKSTSTKPKSKKRSTSRKTSTADTGAGGVNPDNPSLDKHLNTSGIDEFYKKYEPKNHAEKILIFMRFLKDVTGMETPNTDHIYTCYNAVGEKPAAAFAQSFRDTSSKKNGFIDYESANKISLTFIGNRHFDHDLKKKSAE